MNPGDRFYFMTHAYHHFLAEVVEVMGPTRVRVTSVIRVQSCRRGWTEFFRDGCKQDTFYTEFPDGEINGWFAKWDWRHPIPKAQ